MLSATPETSGGLLTLPAQTAAAPSQPSALLSLPPK